MGNLRIKLTAVCMLALSWGTASAIPIVDTGASPYADPTYPAMSLSRTQYIAGRFTTTEEFAITSISAFVRNAACCSGLTGRLNLGIASAVDVSNSQLTSMITLPTRVSFESGAAGWATVAVNNFVLGAGTYWLVASIDPGQSSSGLSMPGGVGDPMDAYRVYNSYAGAWRPASNYLAGTSIPGTFGFRLEGNATVPAPGTLALFGIGLLTLGMSRRRRA
jgi:hypothetical protein